MESSKSRGISDAIVRKMQRIIVFLQSHREQVFISVILILVALLAFGLGRLSVISERGGDFEIQYLEPEGKVQGASITNTGSLKVEAGSSDKNLQPSPSNLHAGAYVASKTGTAYHFPWCPGANLIKDENKIWFASKEEAEAAGYTPAGNCKGI